MSSFGELFDHGIQTRVNEVLSEGKLPDVVYSETDNLGEVVEKLCILHIRTWMLEDAAQEAKTDEENCSSSLLENGSMESIDEHCKHFATSSWTQFKAYKIQICF